MHPLHAADEWLQTASRVIIDIIARVASHAKASPSEEASLSEHRGTGGVVDRGRANLRRSHLSEQLLRREIVKQLAGEFMFSLPPSRAASVSL